MFEDMLHNEPFTSVDELLERHLFSAFRDMMRPLVVVRTGVHPVLEVVVGFHLVRLVDEQL